MTTVEHDGEELCITTLAPKSFEITRSGLALISSLNLLTSATTPCSSGASCRTPSHLSGSHTQVA